MVTIESQQPHDGLLEPSQARARVSALDWAPAALAAAGTVVAVGGTQGGYFPTSWGPSSLVLLALVAVCLAFGATTDVERLDVAFIFAFVALIGWTALSTLWSAIPTETVHEVQRGFVLLAGVATVLLLARRGTHGRVAFAIAAGIVVLCGYGLATRLLPGKIGTFDSFGYRLAEPIGYWNGLGILAAMGVLLTLGIALEAQASWERIAAAVALCVVAPTLYFTYSRGAWVALFVGLAAMVAASPHRLRNLAGLVFVAPAPVTAVLFASTLEGLTIEDQTLAQAVHDGRRMIPVLVACCLLAVVGSLAWMFCETRISAGRRTRLVVGAVLISALVLGVAGEVVREGGPSSLATRARETFDAPQAQGGGHDLNDRLFLLTGSGRTELWQVALSAWESSPALGVGAGSYERYWQESDRWSRTARDAHSLYLETLAELGPLGLLLLVVALGIPVGALVAARRHPVVGGALGAYAAYLGHAGIDWDWELTGVTLAALLIGCVGLIALRTRPPSRLSGRTRLVGGVAVAAIAAFVAVGYVGNDSLDRAQLALDVGNPQAAVSESRIGSRWAPWSPYPLTVRGEALLRLNQVDAARAAFRQAIDRDSGYWRAWLGLAVASDGPARDAAMRHAKALYPQSVEIEQTEQLLAQVDDRSEKG